MGELRLRVTGRNLDLGEALRTRIVDDLNQKVSHYVSRDGDGVVTLSKERHLYKVEIQIHLDSGITLESHGEAGDAHPAFDVALEKIEKRVRRYKNKLKDHHLGTRSHAFDAAYTVFSPDPDPEVDADEGAETGDAPLVIAETSRAVPAMSVSAAVLQLEVSEQPALMFLNPSTGTLNMVYRRADGNIGWMDPRLPAAA